MKRGRAAANINRKKLSEAMRLMAMTVIVLIAAVCRVRGSQEFYLMTGDTMVIPCLAELWSDQSVSCVVGNPDVLMLDGSGRAVIALGAGRSELYVHLTNPDTDVQYTFFVTEPIACYDIPAEADRTEPDALGADSNAGGDSEPGQSAGRSSAGGSEPGQSSGGSSAGDSEPGQSAGGSSMGGSESGQNTGGISEEAGSAAGEDENPSGRNTDGSGTSDDREDQEEPGSTGTAQDPILPAEAPVPEEPAAPFWENTSAGGVVFERIERKNASARESVSGYEACVRIVSDGEVRPVFVSAGGREVRWKYHGGILYVKSGAKDRGTIRGGVLDCKGRMYYFCH